MPRSKEELERIAAEYRERTGRGKYIPPIITPRGVPILLHIASYGIEGTRWIPIMQGNNRVTLNRMIRRNLLIIAKLPKDNVRLSRAAWELVRIIAPGLMPLNRTVLTKEEKVQLARQARRDMLRANRKPR